MDVDLELEYSDRISDFLRSKLQEIKSQNSQLESSLHHRQVIRSRCQEEISKTSTDDSIHLGPIFKKIANGKYVLGLEVKNDSDWPLTDFRVTLNWTSSFPLCYKFHLLSTCLSSLTDILKFTPYFTKSGQIILIFDVPSFSDHLSYTISGSVSFQRNNQRIIKNFPATIQLTPEDFTDNSINVHLYKVIDESSDDLLALTLSSQKQEFVILISGNLQRMLEENCSLHRINRNLFLANKICSALDGAVLEVKGELLNTYCKDLSVTIALLHYLHKHLIGVAIIPRPLYQPDLTLGELTEELRSSLLKDIDNLEKFSVVGSESDILVARINEKNRN